MQVSPIYHLLTFFCSSRPTGGSGLGYEETSISSATTDKDSPVETSLDDSDFKAIETFISKTAELNQGTKDFNPRDSWYDQR